jgi:hypothetical protein
VWSLIDLHNAERVLFYLQYCFARAIHHELGFQMLSNGAGEVAGFFVNKTANVASKWPHGAADEKKLPAGERIKNEFSEKGFRELIGTCEGTHSVNIE